MPLERAFPAALADDVRAVEAILPALDRYRTRREPWNFTVTVASERATEYVLPIIEEIRTRLGEPPPARYGEFAAANRRSSSRSRSRW